MSAQVSSATQGGLPAAWSEGVKALAVKIVAGVKPARAISVEVKNISSLGAGDAEAIRTGLMAELTNGRLRIGAGGVAVGVTLSENIAGYVWVAEIRREDDRRVAMVEVTKGAMPSSAGRRGLLVLHRDLVWQQSAALLDFLVADVSPDGKPLMVALEPRQVVTYQLENGAWRPEQTFRIPVPDHRPRDLRGTIDTSSSSFSFQLSDVGCEGIARRDLELTCTKGAWPEWPVSAGGENRGDVTMVNDRNYFGGDFVLYGNIEVTAPSFLSIAVMNRRNYASWILAELDGKSRLYENYARPAATYSGWGDDVVSVATGCSTDWQVLASGTGDWTQPDHLKAYEPDHSASPRPVSDSLEFPGPIVALWPTPDGKAARIVSRNLQTGMYEASIVSAACSQ